MAVESRSVRRGLSVVVSAALLVTSLAGTSGAITPAESFNISPGQGAPFAVISVSGANCNAQLASAELEDLTGDDLPGGTGPISGANVLVVATPDGAGNWSGNITIPPVVGAGQYRVVAGCGPVAYAPQPFEVLAGDLASMSVSPTQATAGDDVVVRVSGTLCRGANAQADVRIFDSAAQSDADVARVFVTPDTAGSWSGQLALPGTTPAGRYLVVTQCVIGSLQFFVYPPPTIDLVLVVSPNFTG